jgi:hypothetical protein
MNHVLCLCQCQMSHFLNAKLRSQLECSDFDFFLEKMENAGLVMAANVTFKGTV